MPIQLSGRTPICGLQSLSNIIEEHSSMIKRTAINPWQFGLDHGFSQGELVQGAERTLYCAGQASVDSKGQLIHEGDMAGQIGAALDNLEAVLRAAGMSLGSLVRLNIYTTDVDTLMRHYTALSTRLTAARVTPPGTLLGVARLGHPGIMVELEGTAVA
jgi:enamine deaminase RidA (YjgF/YER057c/UK114 family)